MYCSNCGKEVPETSTYCSICGSKIGSPNDPIISGMESFSVNNNSSNETKNSTNWGEIIGGIFVILGIVIYNVIFGVITYFTTPSLVKAYVGMFYLNDDSNHKYDGWYYLIYIIPILLWQLANDKLADWSDTFKSNSIDEVDFFTWFFIFIPIVPTIISFYFLTQNESLPITIQNVGIYILSFISCWQYYWIKKSSI